MTVYLNRMKCKFFFYKEDIRKKQNNVVWHLFCYSEKDLKNGELEGKKNFFPPPFGRCLPCLLWLLSWWGVHRCCGAHSVKLGWLGGGIDRGDVGGYCKTNRGVFVHRITFCVCFPPPSIHLVFSVLCQFGWMLREYNSCHRCSDWANIGRRVPAIPSVPFTFIWSFVLVGKVFFFC